MQSDSKNGSELEVWRDYWDKRASMPDVFQMIRGAPDILSSATKEFLMLNIDGAMELHQSEKLLDAGCGVGDYIVHYFKYLLPYNIVGVDYSSKLLQIARQRFTDFGLQDCPRLVQASITSIPLENDYFDRVSCLSVFQYLNDEQIIETLEELIRVTKSGGVILLHVKNSFTLLGLYQRIVAAMRTILFFKRKSEAHAHIRPFWFYRRLLVDQGLKIEREWSFALFSLPRCRLHQGSTATLPDPLAA